MDDRIHAQSTEARDEAPAQAAARAPYEAPTVVTVHGALTTLLGSAAECTVTEPGPDQDFA